MVMKTGFVHVCFVVDQSSSMWASKSDVEGGIKKIIDTQKEVENGSCAISLFTFASDIKSVYVGKDINDVEEYSFNASGMTAMNDGIGIAIDQIGKWLSEMPEEERPEKNLIVIITDGEENFSREYSTERVREMIRHQTEKYSWEFMYLGTDITTTEQADSLGIDHQGYSVRSKLGKSYDMINTLNTAYRVSNESHALKNAAFERGIQANLACMNAEYELDTGNSMVTND